MKKIMIYAYARFNLGDDLFIKILSDRYPKTEFIMYAPKKYRVMFKGNKNIEFYTSDSIFAKTMNLISRLTGVQDLYQRYIAKSCDGAVYIGGSIFMQQENWEKSYERKRRLRIKDKPFFVLGANFGPYTDQEFYDSYKKEFKTYTDICFREKYSFDLFNDLDNVRMADDVVFQLNKEYHKNKINKQKEKKIVISVIKPSIRESLKDYDNIYYEKLRDLMIYFMEKDYTVRLMSFCKYEKDDEAIESIMKKIPEKYQGKVQIYYYELNIEEALNVIEDSDLVIATRFHSMILGWIYDVPVFPIAYSKKMVNVMEDMEFRGGYIELQNIKDLNIENVYESIEMNKVDVSKQVKSAEKHFEELDKFLI